MSTPRVAVVGAGLSGLSCALALVDRGFDVEVLERDPVVGGRMNTRRRDGFAFDFGASFLADCYSTVGALAARVGVTVESVGLVRHLVLRKGRLHRLNFSNLADALKFGALGPVTRARALVLAAWAYRQDGLDFFDLSTVPEALLDSNAYEFARRIAGRDFADYVVDPFTSTMMFYRAHDICAGAFVALFSMMASGRASFGIRRVVGGMQALPRALAERLPVRTSCPVTAVIPRSQGVEIRVGGTSFAYDAAVLACPAPTARRLLVGASRAQSELLAGADYSSTIDVSFRAPLEAFDDFHCVYVPYRESALISEYTSEAIKGAEAAHGGQVLVNAGLHEAGAVPLLDRPDAVVGERVKAELLRLHPGLSRHAKRIVLHDLQRWPQAIPRHRGDQVARAARFWRQSQGENRVWFCGDYMNHPWLEGAARSGRRAAASVAAALERRAGPSPCETACASEPPGSTAPREPVDDHRVVSDVQITCRPASDSTDGGPTRPRSDAMIRMDLSEQEATILSQILCSDLSDLRMEIAGTESQPFREQLKFKEQVMKDLVKRLEDCGLQPEESEVL